MDLYEGGEGGGEFSVKGGLKSEEEIERFLIDETLGEIERALSFFSGGQPVQILAVINDLARLFRKFPDRVNEVLNPALEFLNGAESDLQIAAAQSFNTVLSEKLVPTKAVEEAVLRTCLAMLDKRDFDVAEAWLPVLFSIMESLPKRILKQQIVKMALAKGDITESVQNRTMCCQILGKLAAVLEGETIDDAFFSKAMTLCQDTDYEVRICMCQQLSAIARSVGLERTKGPLLNELMELLRDEEAEVKEAAFQAVVALLDFLDKDTRKQQILPLIKQHCAAGIAAAPTQQQQASLSASFASLGGDDMARVVVGSIGEILTKAGPDLEGDEEGQLLYDFFKIMSQRLDAESRRLCAWNFPAVLKSLGAKKYVWYTNTFHPHFVNFCTDPNPLVRRTAAAGFHEIASMLGKERVAKYLREPFLRLLQDDSVDVQDAIMETLDATLPLFAVSSEELKKQAYGEILPAVLALEQATALSWRRQVKLLSHLDKLPAFYASETIYDHIMPLLFRYMSTGANPVKVAATRTVCVLVRKNRWRLQRAELVQRLVRDFARGRSYWLRSTFLDLCSSVLAVFSRRFFKESFLEPALDLCGDPVPNVRLRACGLLATFKGVLRLPGDSALLNRLKDCASRLRGDKDRDVAAAAAAAEERMCKIPVRTTILGKDGQPLPSPLDSADDAVDAQRAAEEDQMIADEESEMAADKGKPEYGRRRYTVEPQKGGSGSAGYARPGAGAATSAAAAASASAAAGLGLRPSALAGAAAAAAGPRGPPPRPLLPLRLRLLRRTLSASASLSTASAAANARAAAAASAAPRRPPSGSTAGAAVPPPTGSITPSVAAAAAAAAASASGASSSLFASPRTSAAGAAGAGPPPGGGAKSVTAASAAYGVAPRAGARSSPPNTPYGAVSGPIAGAAGAASILSKPSPTSSPPSTAPGRPNGSGPPPRSGSIPPIPKSAPATGRPPLVSAGVPASRPVPVTAGRPAPPPAVRRETPPRKR
eukprot:tig00000219_g19495.t1